MKRLFTTLILAVCMLPLVKADVVGGNNAGPHLSWSFDTETGVLSITGTGEMFNWFDTSGDNYDDTDFYKKLPWRAYRSQITSVNIADGVTSIGTNSFYFCENLPSIVIPSSVYKIENSAFFSCRSLSSVTFENPSTIIAAHAFRYCQSLTTIELPANIKNLNELSFSSSGLTSITIPASVTSVGENCFAGCVDLASVTFENPSTSLDRAAFSGCTALTTVDLPANLTSLSESLFSGSGLTSITIPSSVTEIQRQCFDGTGLTSVVIPASVTKVSFYAFAGCRSLSSVTFENPSTSFDNGVFQNCTALTTIALPANITGIPDNMFQSSGLTSITIPSGVKVIGGDAFSGCGALTNVVLSQSLLDIHGMAFSGCSQLTTIDLPANLLQIHMSAFGETGLQSVTIPASVSYVDKRAFYGPSFVAYEVEAGSPHYSAYDGVLYTADTTELINIPFAKAGTLTTPTAYKVMLDNALNNRDSLTELYLLGVEEIADRAIVYCENIQRIHFTDALDTFALGSIVECPKLQSIDVPETNQHYTSIDGVLYSKDTTLLVRFPCRKENIDVDVNTGEYTLPIASAVKRILDYSLRDIHTQRNYYFTLPAGLEQIDSLAFYNSRFGAFLIDAWNGNVPAVKSGTFDFMVYGEKSLCVPYNDYKAWAADPVWSQLNLHYRKQDVYSGDLNMSLIHWTLTMATHTLELTGSGPMPTFCDADYYGWWLLRDSIATCTVADGITSIGMYAFVGDTSLTSINFPESLVQISYHAFDGCKNLTIPELPSGLRAIYDYAFRGCQHTPVWSQQFPSTLEHIGAANYVGLQQPTAIYMPASLKYIGDSAFACCPNVEYIHFLDAQVEHIGNYAFVDCPKSGLTCNNNKSLPSTVEYIGDYAFAISGLPVSSQQKYMPYYLPDSLQHIGQGAFRCRTLSWTNIMTLPEHLTYIGDSAFIHANKCTEVRIAARVAPTIGPHTFPASLGLVSVPMGALNSYTADVNWSQLNCHIGIFTMKAGSNPTASSIEIYLQCNESEAAKIDHLEAKNYDVVMYHGSHTSGYVIGLKPETNYDLEVYAISTAGDRERFNINATTAGIDLFRADVQRVDSFFRFSSYINMPGLKDGMGFELQAVEDFHPVGDTARLMAKIEYDGAAQVNFYADTILLNYGQIGECKYRVRAFYYDAQNNRIYYPSDALPDDTWTWVNIEESYWPYVRPIFTVDTVSVSATEMTLKVQFESLGSATISSIDVQVEESQVTASVPFDGNKEQVFTVSGFTPETSYNIWINIMSPQVEYAIGSEFLMHITTRPAPTGIEEIMSDKSDWSDKADSAKKILHNGQIYILRGGKAFDITGQQIR